MMGQLSYQVWKSLNRIYFSFILLAEPLTDFLFCTVFHLPAHYHNCPLSYISWQLYSLGPAQPRSTSTEWKPGSYISWQLYSLGPAQPRSTSTEWKPGSYISWQLYSLGPAQPRSTSTEWKPGSYISWQLYSLGPAQSRSTSTEWKPGSYISKYPIACPCCYLLQFINLTNVQMIFK